MDSDRAYPLQKTIQILKPDANAKQAAKDAELQAKNDLSGVSTMETAEAK
jgi:hypothetical protein